MWLKKESRVHRNRETISPKVQTCKKRICSTYMCRQLFMPESEMWISSGCEMAGTVYLFVAAIQRFRDMMPINQSIKVTYVTVLTIRTLVSKSKYPTMNESSPTFLADIVQESTFICNFRQIASHKISGQGTLKHWVVSRKVGRTWREPQTPSVSPSSKVSR